MSKCDVEIRLENREHFAARGDLFDDGLPAVLDLDDAFMETCDAFARVIEMHRNPAWIVAVAPEQIRRAELGELLERAAALLEQRVLLALHRERVELVRDRVQVALPAGELLEGLVDVGLQRLRLLGYGCVHDRPALDRRACRCDGRFFLDYR